MRTVMMAVLGMCAAALMAAGHRLAVAWAIFLITALGVGVVTSVVLGRRHVVRPMTATQLRASFPRATAALAADDGRNHCPDCYEDPDAPRRYYSVPFQNGDPAAELGKVPDPPAGQHPGPYQRGDPLAELRKVPDSLTGSQSAVLAKIRRQGTVGNN